MAWFHPKQRPKRRARIFEWKADHPEEQLEPSSIVAEPSTPDPTSDKLEDAIESLSEIADSLGGEAGQGLTEVIESLSELVDQQQPDLGPLGGGLELPDFGPFDGGCGGIVDPSITYCT